MQAVGKYVQMVNPSGIEVGVAEELVKERLAQGFSLKESKSEARRKAVLAEEPAVEEDVVEEAVEVEEDVTIEGPSEDDIVVEEQEDAEFDVTPVPDPVLEDTTVEVAE